jgi:hypothetical protein
MRPLKSSVQLAMTGYRGMTALVSLTGEIPIRVGPRGVACEAEVPIATARRIRPTEVLSPYSEAALDRACRRIIGAPNGDQETTVNAEAFSIGTRSDLSEGRS